MSLPRGPARVLRDDWNGGWGRPPGQHRLRPDLELVAGTSSSGRSPTTCPTPRARGSCGDRTRGGYRRTVPDPPVTLGTSDCSVTEGDGGPVVCAFTVPRLSAATGQTVSVGYATADGTALRGRTTWQLGTPHVPGGDHRSTLAGAVSAISWTTRRDLHLDLSSPVNATIADGHGVGTIVDHDPPPTVSVGDCAVIEGNAGQVPCPFTVSRSGPPSTSRPASPSHRGRHGQRSIDYTPAAGTLTFHAGDLHPARGGSGAG